MICGICKEPIERDDTELDWFHINRNSSDTDMLCYPDSPNSPFARPATH